MLYNRIRVSDCFVVPVSIHARFDRITVVIHTYYHMSRANIFLAYFFLALIAVRIIYHVSLIAVLITMYCQRCFTHRLSCGKTNILRWVMVSSN